MDHPKEQENNCEVKYKPTVTASVDYATHKGICGNCIFQYTVKNKPTFKNNMQKSVVITHA